MSITFTENNLGYITRDANYKNNWTREEIIAELPEQYAYVDASVYEGEFPVVTGYSFITNDQIGRAACRERV